jgi:hypothetical protein
MKNSVLPARDTQPRRMLSYGSLKPCTPGGTGNYEAVLAFEEGPISGALKPGSTIPIRTGGPLIGVFFREWAPYGSVFSIHRKPRRFVGQLVHPPGQRFDGAEATAEILNVGVWKVFRCPVGRKREWLNTEAVIFNRDSVPVVGVLFYRLAAVAYYMSDDGHEDLLLFKDNGFREAAC